MPETPRTWTLTGPHLDWNREAPRLTDGECVKVYEAAPVDAERDEAVRLKAVLLEERDPENPERLLDLLERAYHSLGACESISKGGYVLWVELGDHLREYGRLGKEES